MRIAAIALVAGVLATPVPGQVFSDDFESSAGWTLNVPTGVNGADPNFWQIDDDEGGVAPPGCAIAGNGNRTLHVASVFCPTCGASYDAGGLCGILFCPETNSRAESPVFSTAGLANLTLSFDYIAQGYALIDNASVWFDAGSGWTVLVPSLKSAMCIGGQGQWTAASIPLPAAVENQASVRIAFNWTNNDDGVGTDPSVAIDNVRVFAPTAGLALVVTAPAENEVFTVPGTSVTGTVNPAAGVTVTVDVNGSEQFTPAVAPDGTFSQTVTLAEGANTITVTADDGRTTPQVVRHVTYVLSPVPTLAEWGVIVAAIFVLLIGAAALGKSFPAAGLRSPTA